MSLNKGTSVSVNARALQLARENDLITEALGSVADRGPRCVPVPIRRVRAGLPAGDVAGALGSRVAVGAN